MFVGRQEWTIDKDRLFQDRLVLDLVRLEEALGHQCTMLLEGKERDTERSYIGFGQGWVLTGNRELHPDPLGEMRRFMGNWLENLVFINGVDSLESGLMGYLDYEWGLAWQRPAVAQRQPHFFFRVCPVNLVILPDSNRLVLEVFGEDQTEVAASVETWQRAVTTTLANLRGLGPQDPVTAEIEAGAKPVLSNRPNKPEEPPVSLPAGWRSNMTKADFLAKVEAIKEYIRAGDIFQAVFSQRLSRRIELSPWVFYRRLRQMNPSPYLFCLHGEQEILVGSSPELLVSTVGRRVRNRPIAGTRPRGLTPEADLAYEQELRADVKENAEHAMLVDLGRNDVGRVSRYGTVKVTEYAAVERFSHVMHLVSSVEGELSPDQDGLAALQATMPAGTLSGAPKVRAMEILQELEPDSRGAYGGALGIVRWNGDVDFCITIRTLRIIPQEVSVQTGAGIVFDSEPAKEYEETLHKARALMKVVDQCVGND